jgi:hypothetical protein
MGEETKMMTTKLLLVPATLMAIAYGMAMASAVGAFLVKCAPLERVDPLLTDCHRGC